jgi:hypothetical protein
VYCYYQANKRYEKSVGPLRLVKKELEEVLDRPWKCPDGSIIKEKIIFMGSSTDMWTAPDYWIDAALAHCNRYPENTYVFQSKNPARFKCFFFQLPPRVMLGTTIETNSYPGSEVISRAPEPVSRSRALADLRTIHFVGRRVTLFVSIEPVLDFDLYSQYPPDLPYLIRLIQPSFVSIGADSKGHYLPEPTAERVRELIGRLSIFTEVRIKPNLKRIFAED